MHSATAECIVYQIQPALYWTLPSSQFSRSRKNEKIWEKSGPGIAIETTILARFAKCYYEFQSLELVTLKKYFTHDISLVSCILHYNKLTFLQQKCILLIFIGIKSTIMISSDAPVAWKQISMICCEISQHLKLAFILKIIQTFTPDPETLLPTCFVIHSHHMFTRIQLFQIIVESYTKWAVTDMDRTLRSAGQVSS